MFRKYLLRGNVRPCRHLKGLVCVGGAIHSNGMRCGKPAPLGVDLLGRSICWLIWDTSKYSKIICDEVLNEAGGREYTIRTVKTFLGTVNGDLHSQKIRQICMETMAAIATTSSKFRAEVLMKPAPMVKALQEVGQCLDILWPMQPPPSGPTPNKVLGVVMGVFQMALRFVWCIHVRMRKPESTVPIDKIIWEPICQVMDRIVGRLVNSGKFDGWEREGLLVDVVNLLIVAIEAIGIKDTNPRNENEYVVKIVPGRSLLRVLSNVWSVTGYCAKIQNPMPVVSLMGTVAKAEGEGWIPQGSLKVAMGRVPPPCSQDQCPPKPPENCFPSEKVIGLALRYGSAADRSVVLRACERIAYVNYTGDVCSRVLKGGLGTWLRDFSFQEAYMGKDTGRKLFRLLTLMCSEDQEAARYLLQQCTHFPLSCFHGFKSKRFNPRTLHEFCEFVLTMLVKCREKSLVDTFLQAQTNPLFAYLRDAFAVPINPDDEYGLNTLTNIIVEIALVLGDIQGRRGSKIAGALLGPKTCEWILMMRSTITMLPPTPILKSHFQRIMGHFETFKMMTLRCSGGPEPSRPPAFGGPGPFMCPPTGRGRGMGPPPWMGRGIGRGRGGTF